MSAHHVRHATLCPAYGNGELARCTCNAPGSAKTKERMTLGESVAAADSLGAVSEREAMRQRRQTLTERARRRMDATLEESVERTSSAMREVKETVDTAIADARERFADDQQPSADRSELTVTDEQRAAISALIRATPSMPSLPVPTSEDESVLSEEQLQDVIGALSEEQTQAIVARMQAAADVGSRPQAGTAIGALSEEQMQAIVARMQAAADAVGSRALEMALDQAGTAISEILGRHVKIRPTGEYSKVSTDKALRVLCAVQICRACGQSIEVRETEPDPGARMAAMLATSNDEIAAYKLKVIGTMGPRVRFAFHRHTCSRPDTAIAGLTDADLTILEQSLDDELQRIGTRQIAIQSEIKNRANNKQ